MIREENEMTIAQKARPGTSRFAKWWQFFTLALA